MEHLILLAAMLLLAAVLSGIAAGKDYPIQPVPFTSVTVDDGFWKPRMETNRDVTVWYDFRRCEETGRIDNFAIAAGQKEGEFRGIPFDDSDVYKVIEGAAYSLALNPDPKLAEYLEKLTSTIAAAQEPDGYLYTARRILPPDKMPGMSGPDRWLSSASSHELYNLGHLYEAAVALYQATGNRTLLDVSIKSANLLTSVFGQGKLQLAPGHEEIEIGLVKLYRTTGDEKYLGLAQFFVDIRGRADTHELYGLYAQDHAPVVEQDEAVGHSVRAGYLYSGVADVAAMTGNTEYIRAIDRIWDNVVGKKLYLTGGIGARHDGEAFGDNYELPNATAYNETCAAIANALWNHRMFLLHGDAKFVDVLEQIIYNGFLAGVSITGDSFFYPNPLASAGGYERSPWFGCACCPVNVVRFLPEIAGCIYAARDNAAYVSLFIGGSGTVPLPDTVVTLTQKTGYPWSGRVAITVDLEKASQFTLNVRIPGWARDLALPGNLYHFTGRCGEQPSLSINGSPIELHLVEGFARITREWKPGDIVQLDLPMPIRRVLAEDAVRDDAGLAAIQRGPIVYCIEGVDHGGKIGQIALPDDAALSATHMPDLLGGITVVTGQGQEAFKNAAGAVVARPAAMTAIPYYAWCHRGAGPMTVWIPRTTANAVPLDETI